MFHQMGNPLKIKNLLTYNISMGSGGVALKSFFTQLNSKIVCI